MLIFLSLLLRLLAANWRCFSLQDEFSGVITKALSTLVLGLETRLEVELINMARLPWATLEGVGDQSE